MTREEAINKWIIPAIRNTWNDKKCEEIIKALAQEFCEEAISRQAALDEAFEVDTKEYGRIEVVGVDAINSLPLVILQQKIGHWIWQTEDIYRCSECGEDIHVKEVMNKPQYVCCPMCEAKMQEVEE